MSRGESVVGKEVGHAEARSKCSEVSSKVRGHESHIRSRLALIKKADMFEELMMSENERSATQYESEGLKSKNHGLTSKPWSLDRFFQIHMGGSLS